MAMDTATKRLIATLVISGILVGITGCGGGSGSPGPKTVTGVTVALGASSIQVGTTTTCTPTVTYNDGSTDHAASALKQCFRRGIGCVEYRDGGYRGHREHHRNINRVTGYDIAAGADHRDGDTARSHRRSSCARRIEYSSRHDDKLYANSDV